MSKAKRAQEQRKKEEARAQKAAAKDTRMKNPTGGSDYAKKGGIPFNQRVGAEAERRAAEQREAVGAPVEERDSFLSGIFGEGFYDEGDRSDFDSARDAEPPRAGRNDYAGRSRSGFSRYGR